MRKAIILLLVALSAIGCKKKSCYKCTVRTFVSPGSPNQNNTTESVVCDQTEKDIQSYEQANTTTSKSGGVTINTLCNCSKQ